MVNLLIIAIAVLGLSFHANLATSQDVTKSKAQQKEVKKEKAESNPNDKQTIDRTKALHGEHSHHGPASKSENVHWTAPQEAARRKNPVPMSDTSIQSGQKLFAKHCQLCHGPQGAGDGPAAAGLNPKPANLAEMASHHPDGDLAWKIEHGRGAMPGWKSVLKDQQIWDLVNFIKSLEGKKKGAHHHK